MKKILSIFIAIASMSVCGLIYADTIEVGVPITPDFDNNTYVVTPKPDYYYYTGHRCYVEKRDDLGANVLGLHLSAGGGDINCYSYP